jgi:hypothetical protein
MNADGHGWIWGMKMGEPLRREGREGLLDWGLGIGVVSDWDSRDTLGIWDLGFE